MISDFCLKALTICSTSNNQLRNFLSPKVHIWSKNFKVSNVTFFFFFSISETTMYFTQSRKTHLLVS